MKGLVLINGYPAAEKFIRQGERLVQALQKLGAEVELVRNGELYAVLEGKGEARSNLPKDVSFVVYLDKDKYLGNALEACGVRLFNSARAVELCDDKLSTYQALLGQNVPLVQSLSAPLCYTQGAKPNEEFLKNVERELGFPLVAKKSYGSFGSGVQLVHGYAALYALEREWLHTPHFFQRYVSHAHGRDIRVIVIGGRACASMERVAQAGEFRSNIELGGRGRKILLSPTVKKLAEQAAQALELDYCGVDILEGEEGALLCEVNSNAFFEGIEGVTGVDIAALYAEHIVKTMKTE